MSKKQQQPQGQGMGDEGQGFTEDELKRTVNKIIESGAGVMLGGGRAPVLPAAGTSASPAPCETAPPPGDGQAGSLATTVGQDAQPPSQAFTVWTEGEVVPTTALVVITRMASGRHVRCSRGGRTDLVCDVRKAENFRKDMLIFGAVEVPHTDGRVWRYGGVLPRRFGKW